MTPSIKRLKLALLALGSIFIVSVAGYCMFGWGLVDAVYMVVLILSTVGLEEVHQLTPAQELYTTVVIVFGVSTAFFLMGVFIQMLAEGEINRALGRQRVGRGVKKTSGHVIICGFGRMGEVLAGQLQRRKRPFVIIENDSERIAEAMELGYLAVNDNATEEGALLSAGIEKAKTVVTTLPRDADNVFITLTARNLNRDLQIIARGEFDTTRKKLIQAGADRVVLPAATGAMRMAAMITRPSTVELVELVAGRAVSEVDVDEIVLSDQNSLIGKTVREAEPRRRHKLLVVAVRKSGRKLVFNPDPDMKFDPGDAVTVMGVSDDIEKFCEEYGL